MNKRKFLAFFLAVLTVVGCMPLWLFASEGTGEEQSTGYTAPTRQELIDAVGAENIMVDSTFDSQVITLGTNSNDKNFTGTGTSSAHSQVGVGTDPAKSYIYPVEVTEGSGNYAMVINGANSGVNERYIQFTNTNKGTQNGPNVIGPALHNRKNDNFVMSIDVKGIGQSGNIVSASCRINDVKVYNSKTGKYDNTPYLFSTDTFVKSDASGKLTTGSGVVVGQLSDDEFTSISVYVDVKNARYYVFINGENMTPSGCTTASRAYFNYYVDKSIVTAGTPAVESISTSDKTYIYKYNCGDTTCESCSGTSEANHTLPLQTIWYTYENEKYTLTQDDYYFYYWRVYQSSVNIGDKKIYLDNMRAYYTTPETGIVGMKDRNESYENKLELYRLESMIGPNNVIVDGKINSSKSDMHTDTGTTWGGITDTSNDPDYAYKNNGLRWENGQWVIAPYDSDKDGLYDTDASGAQRYGQVQNKNAPSTAALGKALHYYRNKDFVLSVDIKMGDKAVSGSLFQILNRIDSENETNAMFLGSIGSDGSVKLDSKSNVICYLSKDEYTNLALRYDVSENRAYIYVNGVLKDSKSGVFEYSKSTGATSAYEYIDENTGETKSYTPVEGDFYLSQWRILDSTGSLLAEDGTVTAVYLDNFRGYYTNDSVGFADEMLATSTYDELGNTPSTSWKANYGSYAPLSGNSAIELSYKDNATLQYTLGGEYNIKDNYDYVALDIFVPSVYNKVDFLFQYGRTARYYKLKEYTGDNTAVMTTVIDEKKYCLDSTDYLDSISGMGFTTVKDFASNSRPKLTTDDAGYSMSEVRTLYSKKVDNVTTYYVYAWHYSSMGEYALDNRERDDGTYQSAVDQMLTPGWNTIKIPTADLSNVSRTMNYFGISFSGWEMNKWRDWYEKDAITYFSLNPDCDLRIGKLRFLKEDGSVSIYDANIGWSDPSNENKAGQKYMYEDTLRYATGIQIIEGIWYDFGDDGICKGKLNGINKETKLYNGTAVNRLFIDGKIAFGTSVYKTMTVNCNATTGAFDDGAILDSNLVGFEMRLALYNDISAQFRISKAKLAELGYTIENAGRIWQSNKAIPITVTEDKDYFYVATPKVSPELIGTKIEIKVNARHEDIPSELNLQVRGTLKFSIKDYCDKALDGSVTNANGEKELIAAMLEYATAAQKYVASEKNTTVAEGDLLNKDIPESITLTPANITNPGTYFVDGEGAAVDNLNNIIGGISIGLNNGIRIKFNDKANYKVVIKAGETVIDTLWGGENGSAMTAAEDASGYYLYCRKLSAAQLRKKITIEISLNNTVLGAAIDYSFETYAYNKYNSKESSQELKDLVQAMMTYGKYAFSYMDSKSNGGNA